MNYSKRAGWSSLVARQAHNLKVAGSNPAPATNFFARMLREQFSFVPKAALALHEWRRKSMLRTHQKRSSVAQW